jgi:hypothetical protein
MKITIQGMTNVEKRCQDENKECLDRSKAFKNLVKTLNQCHHVCEMKRNKNLILNLLFLMLKHNMKTMTILYLSFKGTSLPNPSW